MVRATTTLQLLTEDDTALLGGTLAKYARAGDTILLRGPIGSGKSALARAFIRRRLGPDTEVPSPTFTLVQTYEDDGVEIWHADLYRLGDAHEAVELGLTDAMDTGICLIEWPELLGDLAPDDALDIELCVTATCHLATITYSENWGQRVAGLQSDAE